jgi:hypothetical protein
MNNTVPPPPPPPVMPAEREKYYSRGSFGTPVPSIVTFAIGIALFFLPFAQLKCNTVTIVQNTGLGIAIGSEWKAASQTQLGNELNSDQKSTAAIRNQHNDPNYYAIAALALGVIGLLLAIPRSSTAASGAMIAGGLGVIALIILWIDLKRTIDTRITDSTKIDEASILPVRIALEMTPWYFLALGAYIAAAIFAYRRTR